MHMVESKNDPLTIDVMSPTDSIRFKLFNIKDSEVEFLYKGTANIQFKDGWYDVCVEFRATKAKKKVFGMWEKIKEIGNKKIF